MAQYAAPGQSDSLVSVKSRYGNFIGGEWVPPVSGLYFENRVAGGMHVGGDQLVEHRMRFPPTVLGHEQSGDIRVLAGTR